MTWKTWKTWTKHAVGATGLLYLLSLLAEHHERIAGTTFEAVRILASATLGLVGFLYGAALLILTLGWAWDKYDNRSVKLRKQLLKSCGGCGRAATAGITRSARTAQRGRGRTRRFELDIGGAK